MPQRVGHVSVSSQGRECSELTRSVMAVPPPRYNQTPSTTQDTVRASRAPDFSFASLPVDFSFTSLPTSLFLLTALLRILAAGVLFFVFCFAENTRLISHADVFESRVGIVGRRFWSNLIAGRLNVRS